MLVNNVSIERWDEYFEECKLVDERKASIRGVGNGKRIPMYYMCNYEIGYYEINGVVGRQKGEICLIYIKLQ